MEWQMVIDELMRWAPIISKEYGLDKDRSIEYFKNLTPCLKYKSTDEYCWAAIVSPDMLGDSILHVIIYYVLPEFRSVKLFLRIQRELKELAKQEEVKYIMQGSHFNSKVNDYLERSGWKPCLFRYEV